MTTAFDLDGVLSRSDTMASMIFARLRVTPWLAVPVAVLALAAALAPATGIIRPRCNRAIVHIALAGMSRSEYIHLAGTVAEVLAVRVGNTAPKILAELRRTHREGSGFVTTASEYHLAAAFLRLLGVDGIPIHASEFHFSATGPRFVRHNVGDAKADARLRSSTQPQINTLYTDSASDLPLARLSAHTVLVGPSARSVRAFEQSGVPFTAEPWESS